MATAFAIGDGRVAASAAAFSAGAAPILAGAAPLLAGVLILPLLSASTQAHVKWFAPYNVAGAPLPLPEVFTPAFVLLLLASVATMVLIYICDRLIADSLVAARVDGFFAPLKPLGPDIMRVTLGAFLLCLWLNGGILLTPELKTQNEAVSWFQLALAISTVAWRTCWIAGFGLLVLYGLAIANYGVFHLLDYPLFIGIAAYLIIISLQIERLKPYKLSILYTAMAVTLLWASVEKWAYSAWTLPLLEKHSRITFGIDYQSYMLMAGFVEFVAAYLLLYGRTSQRVVALMLLAIFLAAIIDFGKIDAVGHAMIIAALAVVVINGNTVVNRVVQNRIPSWLFGSAEMAITYLGYLLLFFLLYYGLHGLIYGSLA